MSSVEVKLKIRNVVASAVMLFVAAGCTGGVSSSSTKHTQKPASKALYQAPPDRVLTSTLMDFTSPVDATFVDATSVRLADDPAASGNRVLIADGGVRLNLTSLVLGRDVGGVWDMVGARVWSEVATAVQIQLVGSSAAMPSSRAELAPREWTKIWLAVPRIAPPPGTQSTQASPEGCLKLAIAPGQPRATLLIDDIALAQSRVTVSESLVPKTNERWRVMRDGLRWIASIDGKTIFELPAAPFVANGYRMLESDPTRALFIDAGGSTLCIDRTGRLIENGRTKLDANVVKVAKAIAENASPASIEVVGGEGRVERSLPGDADNDGYDERRGCYTVRAINGRAAIRLTRRGATVKWPALEVYDLPPGQVSVWCDGAIIPWAERAEDGRVTVELPGELDQPVEVQIRVK